MAGLAAYWVLATPLVGTAPPAATSPAALRLGASAAVAVGLTTAGMLVTDLRHAPACATTLIVSFGLLATPVEGLVIVVAVVVLVAANLAGRAVQSSLAAGVASART